MVKPILFHCAAFFLLLTVSNGKRRYDASPQATTVQIPNAMPAKEKVFAKKIFAALQSGDAKEWMALYPTGEEFHALLIKMAAANEPGTSAEKIDTLMRERNEGAVAEYTRQFKELQNRAKLAGLVWNKTVYGDFIFDKAQSVIKEAYLNGDIWLKMDKTEFVIEGIEAVQAGDGYRLQSITDIKKIDNEE